MEQVNFLSLAKQNKEDIQDHMSNNQIVAKVFCRDGRDRKLGKTSTFSYLKASDRICN